MSKEKIQNIGMAFILNNDPEKINESLRKVCEAAEKPKGLTPRQWNECKFDIEEMGFLLRAFAALRDKVIYRFNARMQGKSREQWQKEMTDLNRTLYPED
ncbi:MAG: hypothetical protein AAF934_03520 [Bacteroidota bacterium]